MIPQGSWQPYASIITRGKIITIIIMIINNEKKEKILTAVSPEHGDNLAELLNSHSYLCFNSASWQRKTETMIFVFILFQYNQTLIPSLWQDFSRATLFSHVCPTRSLIWFQSHRLSGSCSDGVAVSQLTSGWFIVFCSQTSLLVAQLLSKVKIEKTWKKMYKIRKR